MPLIRHEAATGSVGSIPGDLDDLDDVTITSAAAEDLITRNAGNTAWVNVLRSAIDVGDFNDDGTYTVPGDNISTLTNDSGFISAITAEDIGDLSDVSAAGPTTGQILYWDGVSAYVLGDLTDIAGTLTLTEVTGDLADLDDVTAAAPTTGQIVYWDGVSAYVLGDIGDIAGTLALSDLGAKVLDDLDDVTETSITTDDVLQWSGSAWVNQTPAQVAADFDVDDIGDVSVTSLAEHDILVRNGASQWVNEPAKNQGIGQDLAQGQSGGGSKQTIPAGAWAPLPFITSYRDDNNLITPATATTTTIAGESGKDMTTATFYDVNDASGFTDPGAAEPRSWAAIEIGSGDWRVFRVDDISIGGGAGGSDRITVHTGLGAGHRGVGTLSGGDNVKEVQVTMVDPNADGVIYSIIASAAFEAITATAGNYVGVRVRSGTGFFLITFGIINQALNVASQTITCPAQLTLDSVHFIEVYASDAGATTGEVEVNAPTTYVPGFIAAPLGKRTN